MQLVIAFFHSAYSPSAAVESFSLAFAATEAISSIPGRRKNVDWLPVCHLLKRRGLLSLRRLPSAPLVCVGGFLQQSLGLCTAPHLGASTLPHPSPPHWPPGRALSPALWPANTLTFRLLPSVGFTGCSSTSSALPLQGHRVEPLCLCSEV